MTDPPDVARVLDLALTRPPRLGRTRLICVDGPAGSGKTTLAGQLVEEARRRGLTAAVVHMDDVYDGWDGLEDAGRRVDEQIVRPLSAGLPATHERYDWHAGRFAAPSSVPVVDVLVLEGVGSGSPAYDDQIGVLVWVWAPADVRLARGLARDGLDLEGRWRKWMADEERVHARDRTRERADLAVDGRTGQVSPGPASDA